MSASTFKQALALVLAHEGGYVNHPKDPGGATKMGVTQRVYDGYRRRNGLPLQSVRFITNGEAAAIYKQQYWNPIQGDKLPTGVDYAVFDFAVNSGVDRASRYLQAAVGADIDGHIGFLTLNDLKDDEPEKVIVRLCADRMAFLRSLGTFSTFGRGWTRRVVGAQDGFQASDNGVIDYAVNMTRAEPVALPKPTFIGGKVNEPQTAKAIDLNVGNMPVSRPMSYADAKASGWGA